MAVARFVHTRMTRRIDPHGPETSKPSKVKQSRFFPTGGRGCGDFVADPVSSQLDFPIYSPNNLWDPSRVVRKTL